MSEPAEKTADELRIGDVVAVGRGIARVESLGWNANHHQIIEFDNGDRLSFRDQAEAAAAEYRVVVCPCPTKAQTKTTATPSPPAFSGEGFVARAHRRASAGQRTAEMTPEQRLQYLSDHVGRRRGAMVWTPSGVLRPPWARDQKPDPGIFK